jgi:hypothetical protein
MLSTLEEQMERRPLEELAELLTERAELLGRLAAAAPTVELLAQLQRHQAAGERIAARIREDRAGLVVEWNELTYERRVQQAFEASRGDTAGQLLELG